MVNTKKRLISTLVTCCSIYSLPLLADDTTSSAKTMNPLVVTGQAYKGYAQFSPTSGSKTDAEWLDVPQSVSVVTDTEITDRGAVRLVDALNGVAGVNNTLGEGSRDQFVIRGFDALNDVYRDGMRDDTGLQSYRSLANIEQIEVVKGPAGALYGRGSTGGLINLITKRANGDDFTRLNASIGSHGKMVGRVDSSTSFSNTVNGRINVEVRKADSFVDHVDSKDYFIAPTLRFTPSDNHTLDVDLEISKQDLVPYRGVPSVDGKPVNVSRSTYFGSSNDYQESKSVRFSLNDEFKFTPNLIWNNRVVISRVELEQQGTRQGNVTGDTVTQTVSNFGYDPRRFNALQSELKWSVGAHELLFGGEYTQTKIDLDFGRVTKANQSIYDPVTEHVVNGGFEPFRKNDTKTYGLYLQDMYTIGDLTLTGNVRHDKMELEQQRVGNPKENLDDDKWSYRVGASYRLTEDLSTYATFSRSWQLPNAGIFVSNGAAEFYSADLKEIGFKAYTLDDALMFNAAIFQIEQERPVTDTITGDVTDRDTSRHNGFELELRGQLTEQWSATASYTYLDAEDKDTGKKPNDVSDQLFSLGSTYQIDSHWRVGGNIKYVGERYAGNNEAVKLDSYTLVDLMAAYRVGKHSVQFNAYNIFDEEYFLGATGGASGRNQIGYGAPAEYMVSYGYEF